MKEFYLYIRSAGFLMCSLLILYLINPFNYGYAFGYLLSALMLLNGPFLSKNMDKNFVVLLLFSTIYAVFYSFTSEASQGKQYIAIYALTPPFFYILGKFLVKDKPDQRTIFQILFWIGFLFSFSALLSVYMNFLKGGFAQTERTIDMFWNNAPVSATVMGGYLSLNMCIPSILISSQGKKGILFNSIAITIFIITLICAIRLGSRTQLGIFLLTTILSVIYIIPKQSIKGNLGLFALIGTVVYYIYTKVSFSLKADWLTTFSGRMGRGEGDIASGGGRTERWLKSFENLFAKPLGWDLKEFGYSHNLWLDVLRVGGIIPFVILIFYIIRSILQIRNAVRINPLSIALNAQILFYSFAFFALFMVEPVIEGIFSLFVIFCLFMGIVNKYITNSKEC